MLFVDTRTNSYAVWKPSNICEHYLHKFLSRQLDITFNKGTLGENHNQILCLWWDMLLHKTSNTSSFVRRSANFVKRQQQHLIHLSHNLLPEKSSVPARPVALLCPEQLMDFPGALLVKTTFWYVMYSAVSLMSRTLCFHYMIKTELIQTCWNRNSFWNYSCLSTSYLSSQSISGYFAND